MDHGAASAKRAPQRCRVAHVTDTKLDRELAECHRGLGGIPDERANLPAVLAQLATRMRADETAGTGNEHRFLLVCREWLGLLGDRSSGSFAPVGV